MKEIVKSSERNIQKNKSARMSITMNNTTKCSGNCCYCMAANNMDYTLLTEKQSVEALEHIDDMMYNQWKFDPDAIEKTLTTDKRMMSADVWSIDTWGADPVTNFKCLKDMVECIKNIAAKHNKKVHISTSTNGLPLMRDDVTEWFMNNDITIQLSHDGLGQKYRTGNFNPLDIPNVKKLMRAGKLVCINATLNGKNWSLFANMNYFNHYLKQIFPEVWNKQNYTEEEVKKALALYRKLYIKLNHIMDEDGSPFNFTGRVLDDYIEDWFKIWRKDMAGGCSYLEYMPYMRYIREQFKRGSDFKGNGNLCRAFQIGAIERGDHIDSTGRYCQCNLIDADNTVANPSNENPEYCKDCKYKNSGECNMCGSVKKRSDKCEYYYRWNQFLEISRYDSKPQRKQQKTN